MPAQCLSGFSSAKIGSQKPSCNRKSMKYGKIPDEIGYENVKMRFLIKNDVFNRRLNVGGVSKVKINRFILYFTRLVLHLHSESRILNISACKK